MSSILDKSTLVKRASYLRIAASELAEGMKTGNFRSLYRGQGIEFSGVRDYIRGDDIRTIDWNVTARMGKPYVKIFEEERELQIFLVVDSSLSMHLGTNNRTKYDVAAESAALITIASEMNGCPVGAVFFDGAIHFSCEPKFGQQQTMLLLNHLDNIPENPVTGSIIGNALTGAGKLLKKRSLIFVISDFRSANWEKPIISLAHKHDVIAMRIQGKYNEVLPSVGTARFMDIETGKKLLIPTGSSEFKNDWKAYNESSVNMWKEISIKHGITPVIVNTTDDPLQVLTSVFARKKAGKQER
ncbi:MAG: DUF58 domain-containing protein [Treponema sp.]|nr:DUF58 domain-containing protein [Treponema sp.]